MLAKRRSFIDGLVEFSSAGRYKDQDSIPPTSRTLPLSASVDDSSEMVTVEDFLRSSPGPRARSRSKSLPAVTFGRSKQPSFSKRIQCMVRRGSGGLKVQVKKDQGKSRSLSSSMGLTYLVFAGQTIQYVAELQENLQGVQIMVHGVGLLLDSQYVLEVSPAIRDSCRAATLRSLADPSSNTSIQLPCPVLPNQSISLVKSNLHLEARLRSAPTSLSTSSSSSNALDHPMSAADLRKDRSTSLNCASCDCNWQIYLPSSPERTRLPGLASRCFLRSIGQR